MNKCEYYKIVPQICKYLKDFYKEMIIKQQIMEYRLDAVMICDQAVSQLKIICKHQVQITK